jgi:hypothetical protein
LLSAATRLVRPLKCNSFPNTFAENFSVKILVLALSICSALGAISSTGCGGSEGNTVVPTPTETAVDATQQKAYEEAMKKMGDSLKNR